MKRLFKDVMQQLLESEMDEHLGREKYTRSPKKDSDERIENALEV